MARIGVRATVLFTTALVLGVTLECAAGATNGIANVGPPPVFNAFDAWVSNYVKAPSAEKANLVEEGKRLATKRRLAICELIRSHPAEALAKAIPITVRSQLPPEIAGQLESRVSGLGDFLVLCEFPALGTTMPAALKRQVRIDGQVYEACVYGRRVDQTTKYEIPLHGIELEGVLALSADVLRPLEPGEAPGKGASIVDLRGSHPTWKTGGVWAEAAGTAFRFESETEMARKEAQLRILESGVSPRVGVGTEAVLKTSGALRDGLSSELSYASGIKKALVIRVDFSDLPEDPESGNYTAAYLQKVADEQLSPFFLRSSYGALMVQFTVTSQLYRMPLPATDYLAAGPMALNDAASALASSDYPVNDYNLLVVVYSSLSRLPGSTANYGGVTDGGRRVCVNGEFNFRVLAHEIGHTFGLPHANLWQVQDGNPFSAQGVSQEYGDPFDVMGGNFGNDPRADYNPWYKNRINWLPDASVQAVSANGTYRVYAFDQGAVGSEPLALKVTRDLARTFWIGCRRNFRDNDDLNHGAYVIWGYGSSQSSDLIDLTTPGEFPQDAALPVGASVADHAVNVGFHVVGEGGEPPAEYIDLQITFGSLAASISKKPGDLTVGVGQTAVIEMKCDGIPVPTCQWQRQRAGADAWEVLEDGEFASGCQLTVLTLKRASLAMNGDQFRCAVSNSAGEAVSSPARLSVLPSGVFTLAGQTGEYGSADGAGILARFANPSGVALDSKGNLYVTDSGGCAIRKITPAGEVSTYAGLAGSRGNSDGKQGAARFDTPTAIAMDMADNLYVADQGNHVIRVISSQGWVRTLAGKPGVPGSKDGVGDGARFNCPTGIAVGPDGNVFVADLCDNTVRMVTPGGVVTTIAGWAGVRGNDDGTGKDARFRDPAGLATDTAGNVYVADMSNSTIRKVTPAGVVSTVAGVPQRTGYVDGPVAKALFNAPAAVALDPVGNIYVADRGNNALRRITPDGEVSTVAGPAQGDATSGFEVSLDYPSGIAVDRQGSIYVADTQNEVIRWILLSSEAPRLQALCDGNLLLVSWPISASGFVLETSDLSSRNGLWMPIVAGIESSGSNYVFKSEMLSPGRLFRLRSR